MIRYNAGPLGVSFGVLFTLSGSVLPKALFWSVPCGFLGVALFFVWGSPENYANDSVSATWTGYSFVLGFMIVFRMQHAYERFWEAATLTNEFRAEWLRATSCLIAFCSNEEARKNEVKHFQHLIVRLVSMLHRAALEQLHLVSDSNFEVTGIDGIEVEALEFLREQTDRCDVILHWVLRLTVDAMKTGVVTAPAPVMSPIFQEFSQGMVKLCNVQKLSSLPIPFPYVQMTIYLLLFHWAVTPIIAALIMPNWRWAGAVSFSSIFCLWSIYYIAMEIEVPFGSHKNNLPSDDMQRELNRCLRLLLDERAQVPPLFEYEGQVFRLSYLTAMSTPYRSACLAEFPKLDVNLPVAKERAGAGSDANGV